MRALHASLALAAALACSRGDPAAKHRLFAREDGKAAEAAFDPERPQDALALDADQVAARLGAFAWTGAADWTVTRQGGASLHVTEQHQLRQAASGDFALRADVDPGLGAHAVTGKEVVWAGGMTYARALPAAFRQRPTDRGRDARRYREDSFGLVRTLAGMMGPALRLERDGERELLGRSALRYRFVLASAAAPAAAPPAPAGLQARDADTAVRQGFLRDAVPTTAEGELLVDTRTGAPLRARLSAVLLAPAPAGGKGPPPEVKVSVSAQLTALGGEVPAVTAPPSALPDERKPAGPSAALEAAGLKARGEEKGQKQAAEPADEAE